MRQNKIQATLGLFLLGGLALFLFLTVPQSAQAQCGSSASSCKNCHEVQGEDPVNSDGTNWHEAHAFGDFCEFCHAGNVQATDKESAHVGLEAPMANVQVSCGNCHAADLDERANVYAVALGVEIGSGGGSAQPPADSGNGGGGSGGDTAVAPPSSANSNLSASSSAGSPSGLVVDDPNVIDYVTRYNETVLGIKTVNWGNRILFILIAFTLVGGGGFVVWNELRLRQRAIPVTDTVIAEQTHKYPDYPPQVIALLPRLAQLSPEALQDLYQFLAEPAKAQSLLHDLVRLQPELIRQVRELDRESQALLLALASSGS